MRSGRFAVDPCQAGEILPLRQHLRLERLQPRGQGRPTLPDLLRADQPEGRMLGKPLGVVDILVTREPAVDLLPEKVCQKRLHRKTGLEANTLPLAAPLQRDQQHTYAFLPAFRFHLKASAATSRLGRESNDYLRHLLAGERQRNLGRPRQ